MEPKNYKITQDTDLGVERLDYGPIIISGSARPMIISGAARIDEINQEYLLYCIYEALDPHPVYRAVISE